MKVGDLIIEYDCDGNIEGLDVIIRKRAFSEFNEERWVVFGVMNNVQCDYGPHKHWIGIKWSRGKKHLMFELVEV